MLDKKAFLTGEHVYLRPFEEKDIECWHKWFNDPEVTLWMERGFFPNNPEKQKEHLKHISKSETDLQLAIVAKEGDRLIGTIGLHMIDFRNSRADVSILIGDRDYWGKGLAAEAIGLMTRHAFQKMGLRKLTSGADERNTACIKAFEKNGYKQEGLLKEHIFTDGKYGNIVLLAAFKDRK
jgi:RimJ/RimL family protein N-acetyltransferase